MWKNRVITVCASLMLLLSAMQAGNPVKLGIKGGFELTEMNFNAEDLRETNRLGYYFGPVLQFGLPLTGLGIDISALYSKRNLKVDDDKVPQKCVLLPANLRFGVEIGDLITFFASAGPQFSFNIGKGIYYWKEEDQTNRQFLMQNTTVSFNFGLGVHLEHHLEAAVYYNLPMGKAADFTWDKLSTELKEISWNSAKTKTNAWQVTLSFYF